MDEKKEDRVKPLSGFWRRLAPVLLLATMAPVAAQDGGWLARDPAGNVAARLPGRGDARPLILSAHMDTVGPAENVRPRVERDRITSDGTTILGADCKAGIAVMMGAPNLVRGGSHSGNVSAATLAASPSTTLARVRASG